MFKIIIIIASLLLASPAFAVSPPSYYSEYFHLGVEELQWTETPSSTRPTNEWTEEQGALISLGYTYGTDWKTNRGLFYRHTQKMYFGGTRYHAYGDSFTSGEDKGYSLYTGFDYSRKWGHRSPLSSRYSVSPVITLGIDGLGRGTIGQSSRTSEDEEITEGDGHEIIVTLYSNAGLMLSRHFDEQRRLSIEAGVHRPLLHFQYHHSNTTLRPRNVTGSYLTLEYSHDGDSGMFARINYLDRAYGESGNSGNNWYQPDTDRKSLGLTLGWYL